MRRTLFFAVLLAFFAAASAFAFDAAELNTITFVNATGAKIEMIFLSPGDSRFWGPDIVGADYIVKNGDSVSYFVHYPGTSFNFDIMAIDDLGNRLELFNYRIDDRKESTVRLTRDRMKGVAPDFRLVTLGVENNTGKQIDYLFVSPSDSNAWGCDLLDSETTLPDRDTHSVVVPVATDRVTYNIMAVDTEGAEYKLDVKIDPTKGDAFSVSVEPQDLSTE